MLPDSATKLREPVAALLLGATLVYLVVTFTLLFKDSGSYAERAFLLQDRFVDPVWVLVVVPAALLVVGERTPRARLIVLGVLAVLGLMALLGFISWVSGLGVDLDRSSELFLGGGRLARSFVMLAELAVLAGGLILTYRLLRSLPAPVRAPKTQQQQWGAPQQHQWGTSQQPRRSAPQQPWPGQHPSWGGGGATAYEAGSQPAQQPGQPPGHQPASPGPPPEGWGYPAPQPSPWPAPPPQQQSWSGPAPSQPDSTAEWITPEHAAPQEPQEPQEPPPAERRDDSTDDPQSSWWPPRT